jgi:hypothetical protein
MNLTYTIHNDLIIKKKALILQSNFDCKTLFVAPIVKKNNFYKNYVKKEPVPDYESDNDDFKDNYNCDFIDI